MFFPCKDKSYGPLFASCIFFVKEVGFKDIDVVVVVVNAVEVIEVVKVGGGGGGECGFGCCCGCCYGLGR